MRLLMMLAVLVLGACVSEEAALSEARPMAWQETVEYEVPTRQGDTCVLRSPLPAYEEVHGNDPTANMPTMRHLGRSLIQCAQNNEIAVGQGVSYAAGEIQVSTDSYGYCGDALWCVEWRDSARSHIHLDTYELQLYADPGSLSEQLIAEQALGQAFWAVLNAQSGVL